MFPSYLPVKAPDPGAYHFNFLGHNQKCLTPFFHIFLFSYSIPFFARNFTKQRTPKGILRPALFYIHTSCTICTMIVTHSSTASIR